MNSPDPLSTPAEKPSHFIRDIVSADVAAGKNGGQVVTRFPPEPNGYLHIGHAKAICLDFGIAEEFGGRCHLRMDDTNPAKESMEYVDAIREDIRWLGFDWGEHFYFSADYFERMYEVACALIGKGNAYVCDLSSEAFKEYRGVPTRPGKESPGRLRSVEENLDLFARMRAGEFPDGAYCLRARIDMASPNLHLRDPVLYRVMRAHHYRTGDAWCLYPMYDFAHPLEDAFEGVTHSLCTLEFEVHRPLYDWVVDHLDLPVRPRQYEFARLNLTYTVMSKRKLLQLVQEGLVSGWDDPRMPTICGLRRRGYPAAALRAFCEKIGITKYESLTDVALLEHCVREELNRTALRRMAVFDPLKVVLTNLPEGEVRTVSAVNNPEDPEAGHREVAFGREILIEQDDFAEEPPPKFFRLAPGKTVRLRYAGYLTCEQVVKDADGRVVEVHGRWDPPDAGIKVKGTIHWVPAVQAVEAEIRLYDRLFRVEEPDDDKGVDFKTHLNPESLKVTRAWVEPALAEAEPEQAFQFERIGYFCADRRDHGRGRPVFNRTVTLKDLWGKKG
ncbi:MAG TPA: glutamine--tRNA ligase/YqeY domain fusion protein [Kiritimatiellia bacterium]|nr:glutamine--tRNA ligase/YqeY domain fusion protein [Kiritimatiellia bacterium]